MEIEHFSQNIYIGATVTWVLENRVVKCIYVS